MNNEEKMLLYMISNMDTYFIFDKIKNTMIKYPYICLIYINKYVNILKKSTYELLINTIINECDDYKELVFSFLLNRNLGYLKEEDIYKIKKSIKERICDMNNERRLLNIIIEDSYKRGTNVKPIMDIIVKYKSLCYDMLIKCKWPKEVRINLLNAIVDNSNMINNLCNIKKYINMASNEEKNILLAHCDENSMYFILDRYKSININKININEDRKKKIIAYLTIKKIFTNK